MLAVSAGRRGGRRLAILLVTAVAAAWLASPVGQVVAPAAASTGASCDGHHAYTLQGHQMRCTFDDEFSAATGDAHRLDPSKWLVQRTANSGYVTGPTGSLACYGADSRTVAVAKGQLRLSVRRTPDSFTCSSPDGGFTTHYVAGMVSTSGRFSQTYGRFAVRAKLPAATTRGLQETLWLWPTQALRYGPRPASGEIDFAEFYSQYSSLDIPYIHYNYDRSTSGPSRPVLLSTGALHRVGKLTSRLTSLLRSSLATTTGAALDRNVVTAENCAIRRGHFNTYVVTWAPGVISIGLNGRACLTDDYVATGLSGAAPFDQPFLITLTQALGIGTNAFRPGLTKLPATTRIDWVRAWA